MLKRKEQQRDWQEATAQGEGTIYEKCLVEEMAKGLSEKGCYHLI